jgi:hypothetical protein
MLDEFENWSLLSSEEGKVMHDEFENWFSTHQSSLKARGF